jgi:hypothetical protein
MKVNNPAVPAKLTKYLLSGQHFSYSGKSGKNNLRNSKVTYIFV